LFVIVLCFPFSVGPSRSHDLKSDSRYIDYDYLGVLNGWLAISAHMYYIYDKGVYMDLSSELNHLLWCTMALEFSHISNTANQNHHENGYSP